MQKFSRAMRSALTLDLDAAFQTMKQNSRALWYMMTQLAAKAMAAVAQLYAIYVFSKIHAPNDAALIFILFGYGIWVQIFELGVSQVIQNGLNTKLLKVTGACQIIVWHYGLMVIFAAMVFIFPEILKPFQGVRQVNKVGVDALAFPVGIALMLVATNNALVQRMLLVINHGLLVSKLMLLQASLSVIVLLFFQWRGANLIQSIALYLSVPLLIYFPLVWKFFRKAWHNPKKHDLNWRWALRNALGFWGLTALSLIYLGADYFFAAKYMTSAEIIAYHFSSRLFFISYIAYFSYVQYRARGITATTRFARPEQIWTVVKGAACIGILSVVLVLVAAVLIEYLVGLDRLGVSGVMVLSLLLPAALYYGIRVFRDAGLVVIWNMGLQRFLYALHMLEVVFGFLWLTILAPGWGGKGVFFAMALTAALSTTVIYIALRRLTPRFQRNT